MKKITLQKVSLEKDVLLKFNNILKKRFVVLTSMMEDSNLLLKCLLYSQNSQSGTEVFDAAKTVMGLFYVKLLISKTYEMWTFLQRNNITKEQDSFSEEIRSRFALIDEFFSDDKTRNIFAFIRDKFGFHYEYQNDIDEKIARAFDSLEKYKAYLSKGDAANEIYFSTDEIIWRVIFKEMRIQGFTGDDKELFEQLYDLALKGASVFREFCMLYVVDLIPGSLTIEEEIKIEVPSLNDISLPLIVARDED